FLALAPDPEILVLDDPWLGLDVVARRDFLWAALEMARDEGKTILFTSHIVTDVERIVDRVAVMDAGRVRLADDLDALKARTKRIVVELHNGDRAANLVVPGEIRRHERGGAIEIVTEAFEERALDAVRARFPEARVEDLNLEEVFYAVAEDRSETSGEDACRSAACRWPASAGRGGGSGSSETPASKVSAVPGASGTSPGRSRSL